jgi:hypothetical protein
MRSQDVLHLFTTVGIGTRVDVVRDHLPIATRAIAQAASPGSVVPSVRR